MCMAVGKVSLDDCDMLTSSFGCTGVFEPITPPAISMARFEITSLAFMLVCVPEPVCQMRSGKWASSVAVAHLAGGVDDQRGAGLVHLAQLGVGHRGGFFEQPERPDDGPGHLVFADGEVNERALGLRAPVGVGGNLDGPHGVGLDARSKPTDHPFCAVASQR